ncbi:uncharacterized protein BO72DRAFT_59740 [Aspergillus fijiensis CBS 313.89]|uniref:Uncharacterized protein n=1 Tax=Aspergillus fijiensis CBS 313.89 TaxID=1448319 RepID=A0A8G1VZJ6_9EURO|nr:uncharacterized protein BO72DRAFT_59740 [Aspergillus fijiensis CBS 313.89]RAK78885.1 hypothetical protein BO72DRAFT_59740 [Aspergillus fijiensis CBS 313.89]
MDINRTTFIPVSGLDEHSIATHTIPISHLSIFRHPVQRMTPTISSTKAVPSASPYTEVRTVPNRCECVAESKSGNYWDDEPLREEILKAKANQQKEWWIPRPGHSLDLWGRLLSDTFGLAGDGEILPDNLDDTLPAHVVAAEIYNARYPLTGVVRYLRLSECVGRPLWPLTDCALVVIDLIPGNSSKLVREAFPERARALDRLIRSSTTPTHKEEEPHIKQEGGKEEEEEEEPVKELVRYPFIRVFCTWGDKEHPDPSLDECREIVTQLGMTDEARRTCRAFFLARGSRVGIYTWDRSGQGRTVLPLRVHPDQGDDPFLCLADDHARVGKIVQQLSREVHAVLKLAAFW